MAQTLLAILFATSSANDQTIAFRWPASPYAFPRLARPRPPPELNFGHVDTACRAATYSNNPFEPPPLFQSSHLGTNPLEYEWQRPTMKRYRSHSFASSGRSSSNGRHSPVSQRVDRNTLHMNVEVDEYDTTLGFNVNLLAHFLCPKIDNCHQKFELIVDDLAFIGHPVCVDERGNWSFKWETPPDDKTEEGKEVVPPKPSTEVSSQSMLQLFHVVFVLDLPDPSSSSSGNLNKYFDAIYQSVAFTLTAVLFNEQVLHKYVEHEWDVLVKIKDDCISNGLPYDDYVAQCLKQSSLARALEHIYTSIRANSLVRLTINNISLDLQLPPFLDSLLRTDPSDPSGSSALCYPGTDRYEEANEDEREDDDYGDWGPELSFGWRLPALTPWKSLLLLDMDPRVGEGGVDPLQNLDRPGLTKDEREIAEGISRFLDNASVFVPLNDMATLLDWDLHKQVFPTVRYLVQRRRAKVVDLVRSSLKSVFTLPARIETPMSVLTVEFAEAFPTLPSLPVIFSRLSSSPDNFFESVVRSKEQIPIYKNVIVWLLKRDLLVMLHMRFRIIATPALKRLVVSTRQEKRKAMVGLRTPQYQTTRGGQRKNSTDDVNGSPSLSQSRELLRSIALLEQKEETVREESEEDGPASPSGTPLRRVPDVNQRRSFRAAPLGDRIYESWDQPEALAAERHRQQHCRLSASSSPASRTRMTEENFWDSSGDEVKNGDGYDVESDSESDPEDPDDLEASSVISNPERATPKERRWLRGMVIGKNPVVAKRFEDIHKYFDGEKTGDEILFKAEISRKQLREVLHEFTDHITTFLHP